MDHLTPARVDQSTDQLGEKPSTNNWPCCFQCFLAWNTNVEQSSDSPTRVAMNKPMGQVDFKFLLFLSCWLSGVAINWSLILLQPSASGSKMQISFLCCAHSTETEVDIYCGHQIIWPSPPETQHSDSKNCSDIVDGNLTGIRLHILRHLEQFVSL